MAPSAQDTTAHHQVWEEAKPNMPLDTNTADPGTNTSTLPAWSVQSDKTDSRACCGIPTAQRDSMHDPLVAPWVDWVEGGIEFFGCDAKNSKSFLGRTLTLSHRMAGAVTQQNSPRHAQTHQHQTNTRCQLVNHAKLHDDFIEALFQEQWSQRVDSDTKTGIVMRDSNDTDDDSSSIPLNRIDSTGTEPPSRQRRSDGSWDASSVSSAPTPPTSSKRRLPLKFMKSSASKHSSRIAPIDSYQQQFGGKSTISPKSVLPPTTPPAPEASTSADSPPSSVLPPNVAESMVHSECKIQKDKGKGEPVGTSINADGRANCLAKLREKIRLLVQVALDGPVSSGSTVSSASSNASSSAPGKRKTRRTASSAGMKRRPAKISEETPLYTETRSMIELRLGFVSMQYGLLLRWDRTGKIIFIVLRKMCHDSFYKKIKEPVRTEDHSLHREQYQQQLPKKSTSEPPPLVVRNMVGDQAIYQRVHGTEVVLVDSPYRVPQPSAFEPSILSVQINHVKGLSQRQRWTISLTFDGHTEVSELVWKDGQFIPRRVETMEWEISPMTSFDLAGLEIRLFEQLTVPKRQRKLGRIGVASLKDRKLGRMMKNKGKNKNNADETSGDGTKSRNSSADRNTVNSRYISASRVFSDLTMPLGGLVAQPSTAEATTWELTIPANDSVSITLSLVHQSEYAHWLYKELDARRREEIPMSRWRVPFHRTLVHDVHNDDDDENDDLWDWLCGFCNGIADDENADCSAPEALQHGD